MPRPATYSKRQLREYVECHEARGATLLMLGKGLHYLRNGTLYVLLDDREKFVDALEGYLRQIGRAFESEAELQAFCERYAL